MSQRPRVLGLGGLDPTGGAGLTAYARMVQARGGLLLPVATCLTVQNRRGMDRIEPIAADVLAAALRAACEDGPVDAVVVGLLGNAATAELVAELAVPLHAAAAPLVVDPVLAATAGGWDGSAGLAEVYRRRWMPLATVVCPNLDELRRLAPAGPPQLLALGASAALVKGGHGAGDVVEDRLYAACGEVVYRHPRRDLGPVHGTGCALAAALASELGRGLPLDEACRVAIAAVGRCLDATRRSIDGAPVPLVIV